MSTPRDDETLKSFLSVKEKNTMRPKKLTEEINYSQAIIDAGNGNPYALAQLGKYYYSHDKEKALRYFDAAINADPGVIRQATPENNLAYQIAAYLPDSEPKKVEYYCLGLKGMLDQPYMTEDSVSTSAFSDYKENTTAMKFLLRKQGKVRPHFKFLMLTLLDHERLTAMGEKKSGHLYYQHIKKIGRALAVAGYYPRDVDTTHIPIPGRSSEYFDSARKEFLALIEYNPVEFRDAVCKLSLEEFKVLFRVQRDFQGYYLSETPSSIQYQTIIDIYKNLLAEDIRLQMVMRGEDIETAKKYFSDQYHTDYFIEIDALVQQKLTASEAQANTLLETMKSVCLENNRVAHHMLSDLPNQLTYSIETLRSQLPSEYFSSSENDLLKEQDVQRLKNNKKNYVLYLQLKAFQAVQHQYNRLNAAIPSDTSPHLEDIDAPPSYDLSDFEKLLAITTIIEKENATLQKEFQQLKGEPTYWLKYVGLFFASITLLIFPMMAVSKYYKNTVRFWNTGALATAATKAKQFSDNTILKGMADYSEKEERKNERDKRQYSRLLFLANKKQNAPSAEDTQYGTPPPYKPPTGSSSTGSN